ncbi:hypothetical protein AC480_03510 [miscellaneous Crenarchaeota group archaeon SMTZ1-55]|nr:MAG: hypothetical protein AC480_03510 [miscellaneous Crenarchaeota group archaeon SMTZ1-55]
MVVGVPNVEKQIRTVAQNARIHLAAKTQAITLTPIVTEGFILDLGGGGEGMIGRLNGRQVIAVDNKNEELRETNNESVQLVMDARALAFPQSSFATVTSFFTLMYLKDHDVPTVFREVFRVLKAGGRLLIWDARIPRRVGDEPGFGVVVTVSLPDAKITTGYGIRWAEKAQDLHRVKTLASQAGFRVITDWVADEVFFLELLAEKHH